VYKGNQLQLDKSVLKGEKPSIYFQGIINGLHNRVVNDCHIGSGVPASALGQAGDTYIDLAGLKSYLKNATVWDGGTALDNNVNTVKLTQPNR